MQLATRMDRLVSSPVRDLLALTEQPDVISFAGGLPAQDSFPSRASLEIPESALQYGASEGDWPLRERIAALVCGRGLQCDPEHVIVLSGSQQGIDLVAKLLVDTGTPVAVESPTYLAALQVFSLFGAHYRPFAPGQAPPSANLVYLNPTFQNPTGHCYSTAEREHMRVECARHQAVLFEDDPYHDLCFENCDRTPVVSGYAGDWVYQGSFSKSLAPGMRLGYLVASENLVQPLIRLKQAADLHSNRLAQAWVMHLLEAEHTAERVCRLQDHYRARRDHFGSVLDAHFGDLADWSLPEGGLFFWLTLRDRHADTTAILEAALAEKVVFMPGRPFYPDTRHADANRTLRLNFSNATRDDVERGLAVLAPLIRSAVQG